MRRSCARYQQMETGFPALSAHAVAASGTAGTVGTSGKQPTYARSAVGRRRLEGGARSSSALEAPSYGATRASAAAAVPLQS